MIISGMLVWVKLPPFFPFLSKFSSTLKLMQFLNGLSYSDELGGKLKVFPCIFHNTFHLECHGHKQIIIFASTHGSEIIHFFGTFFLVFGKLPFFFKPMPFLNEQSYSNELGGIRKIFQSSFVTSCGFQDYLIRKWRQLG